MISRIRSGRCSRLDFFCDQLDDYVMSETPQRLDIYSALPQGLVPRGLVPAVAAAYVGLTLTGFLQVVEEGQFSPPTLPNGNFDQRCLDRDLDRLSSIEAEKSEIVSQSLVHVGGPQEYRPTNNYEIPAKEVWRKYFSSLTDYLAILHAEGDPENSNFELDIDKPDPAVLTGFGRNLAWFAECWKSSPHFKTKISDSSRVEYARLIGKVADDLGQMPLAVLDDPDVAVDLDEWASIIEETSGPREADARLAILSSAATWAVRSRSVPELKHNYVKGFRRRHSADRSGLIFTDAELEALQFAADAPIATGILIGGETALRISDVLALTWNQYDGDLITVVHGKQRTGRPKKTLRIPCSARLKAHLDAMPRGSETIIATSTGGRWERRRFSGEFRELCQKTEILGRHFHDLRGTAITRYAELGMTAEMISAITGHSIKTVVQILERYMARTEKMARAVIASVDASRVIDVAKKAG